MITQRWASAFLVVVLVSTADGEDKSATPSLAERVAQVRDEYQAKLEQAQKAAKEAKTEAESLKRFEALAPDLVAYCRRMLDLAAPAPKDPAARDAFLWIVDQPGMSESGEYGELFGRATTLLVNHHADDPEVARVGLSLSHQHSHRRDAFLMGVYAMAQGHEAKGLARLALAYSLQKIGPIIPPSKHQGRKPWKYEVLNDQGKMEWKEMERPAEFEAYDVQRSLLDPEIVHEEAERLYREVIAEYADIPFVTRHMRELETRLRAKPLATITDPEKRTEWLAIERYLAQKKTIGQFAEEALDEMHALAPGQTAPEIDGKDLDGKPLRLSDYRGKVIVLVFWGTWCGPCMAEIPHERELAERFKDQPFALLGVDCDEDIELARKAVRDESITWPNWNDGGPYEGPIQNRYHVRGYPSQVVIDAKGIIRYRGFLNELEKKIEELLKELESPETSKPVTSEGKL